MEKEIKINPKTAYTKTYTMTRFGLGGVSTVVTIPRAVVLRKAREVNLTPEEFVKQYEVVAHYNGFDGVFYTFKKKGE